LISKNVSGIKGNNVDKAKDKRKREDVEDEAAQLAKTIKVPQEIDDEEDSFEEPQLEAEQAIKHEEPSTQDPKENIKDL
jgi:hypothetical protein